MLKATLLVLTAISLAAPLATEASTLYRCTDEFGHATYTNYKAGNRKCIVLSRDDTSSSNSQSAKSSPSAGAKSTPADFPRVAKETQKSRDGDRRYILDQEMSTEQKNLEEARKSLAAQLASPPPGMSPTGLQPLRDRIALHERNLDALRREIANLK